MMDEQSYPGTKPKMPRRISRRTVLAIPILVVAAWGVSRSARPWRPFEFLCGMEVVGPPIDYSWNGDPQRCFVFSGEVDYEAFCARAEKELVSAGWRRSPLELPPQLSTFVQVERGAK